MRVPCLYSTIQGKFKMRDSLKDRHARNMKSFGCWKEYLLILSLGLCIPISAIAQQREYAIKVKRAVFFQKFSKYIEWPESSGVSDTSTSFIIAVIGESPFGSILEKAYAKQKIKNKKVEILYFSTSDEIADCHILFISNSTEKVLPEILSRTRNKPILTVSDTEGFAQKKVLINFYDEVKFEINEKAVHESGLAMSYRLLNRARIVDPIKERK